VSCDSAEAFQTGGNKWLSMTGSEEEFILEIFRNQSCAFASMDGEKEAGAKHFVALNTQQRPLYRPLCGPWHCAL
jgi:hypothetical protein